MMRSVYLPILCAALLFGCDSSNSGNPSSDSPNTDLSQDLPDAEKILLDSSQFTYTLTESLPELTLWTTPATHKVLANEQGPTELGSGLSLSAARNEFEPMQLVLGPATADASLALNIAGFETLGAEFRLELSQVLLVDNAPDQLEAIALPGELQVAAGERLSLWLTAYIPSDAPAGEHHGQLLLEFNASSTSVPLSIEVFDFTLPSEIGFATQLNLNISSLIPQGGNEEQVKDMLFAHRLTPKSVTWPSGFNWQITWENSNNPQACESLWTEIDEGEQWGIWSLGPKYILGQDWNGVGFPNAMIMQFVDNSTPRPATFCGVSRGDHFGSDSYNAQWSAFLGALEEHLEGEQMLDKAYYYVQNEPQDQEDHALAAHLCRLSKAAAPNLRLAISEEPKAEIAEDPQGACGYDIWIAHLRAYQQDYAWQRQQEFGEAVWLYSLDHDPDPYYNPTSAQNDGMHTRIIPWVAWASRTKGWAYYDANRFFYNGEPGIRAALLREGIEDYEYLLLANGGHPSPGLEAPLDPTVAGMATSLTSWNRSADELIGAKTRAGSLYRGLAGHHSYA